MSRVELRNIEKSYDKVSIIENLNLEIEDGSFTVLVGPSGSGKSTLLRMIGGLEDITDGELSIGGAVSNELDPIDRGVAMVFQNYALYPNMTVQKNIGFPLLMAGMKKSEVKKRVQEAADSLQITPLLNRKPGQLSGGQRQRVAIGRAIVREPKVFLFDEPLSNLDAELRVTMRAEIASLHRNIDTTMIYVTHDQTEAMTLADKIVVLRDGKIEQFGTPTDLYEQPANEFVAGFIGSPRMNFLGASVDANNIVELKVGGQFCRTAIDCNNSASDMKVGIRPEHFGLPCECEMTVEGEVSLVEYLGGTRFIHMDTSTGESLVIEDRSHAVHKVGEISKFGFNLSRIHEFSTSGQSVTTTDRVCVT